MILRVVTINKKSMADIAKVNAAGIIKNNVIMTVIISRHINWHWEVWIINILREVKINTIMTTDASK